MKRDISERIGEIARRIQRADSIGIYCHTNPDGDTLCSALALYAALAPKGKRVEVFCDEQISSQFGNVRFIDRVSLPQKGVRDLAIAVDCSSLDRLGIGMKSFLSARQTIAVDHHKSHQIFADLTAVDPAAAACAEPMYEIIEALKAMNDECAELLFGGIVADTGCFQYSSTTRRTHSIACELMRYDFDASEVVYDLHKRIEKNVFALKNRVLSGCRFFCEGRIAAIKFGAEDFAATDTAPDATKDIITSVIDIDGVEVAFSIAEISDKNFRVSIRTKSVADASDIAAQFGGGGHLRAAGCRLNGYYEDVLEKLLKAARDRI